MNMTVLLALIIGAGIVIGLASAPISVTRRAGLLLLAASLLALVLVPEIALVSALAVGAAFVVDAFMIRRAPSVRRDMSTVLSRGVASPLHVESRRSPGVRVRLRQPQVPDIAIEPPEGTDVLDASVIARRRGRHHLPPVATRTDGPLRLASWYRGRSDATELLVYPDLPAARRLALAVRQGRFRDPGRLTRGPLGLGTDFESIRDYSPDDDARQINWRATQRMGRPMSNQYRVEQDREIVCVIDAGRLMTAPIGTLTRLDAALDAVAAVALVADEVGDRCGAVAFDSEVRRRLSPRRSGGDAVIRATFDLEPSKLDADYELAFRTIGGGKRAFVLVLTDLLDEAAADALVDAVPVLARRHMVVIASATDPDLAQLVANPPASTADVYAASAALEVLNVRARVAAQLRHAGAQVLEASPERLATACVGAYLRAKARARL